jgi:hypothetical protein
MTKHCFEISSFKKIYILISTKNKGILITAVFVLDILLCLSRECILADPRKKSCWAQQEVRGPQVSNHSLYRLSPMYFVYRKLLTNCVCFISLNNKQHIINCNW